MQKIVLASNNAGKVREIQALWADSGVRIVPQSDFQVPEVEETGLSFVENAILKARHAGRYAGLPTLADDSGLEVDALRGAPGVFSARFAGPKATDADNNTKLLDALKGIPEPQRTARFRCVMAFLRHPDDASPILAEGVWEGSILDAPRGAGGFGYDPLFFVPEQGCSSAELSAADKNRLSHRGQALRAVVEKLRRLTPSG